MNFKQNKATMSSNLYKEMSAIGTVNCGIIVKFIGDIFSYSIYRKSKTDF